MMGSTVDQRIVEMQFNNQNFEQNAQTSINTLDRLKESLNLSSGGNALASSLETISSRFTALGIVGVTAIQNITNSAINAGKSIVSALTIDPVKTGLNEYEQKINSVQTILMGARNENGTAVSLDQVKQKLEELNVYADKTIYSFQDMTTNIGKFTNAGVDLNTSVAAIQGIANVAAVSGANANQASHAMYNFAQALSAGYVKLIDWKSIENAQMATVEFKEELLKTAVAVGTLEKSSDGMYKVLTQNGQGSTMKDTINATKNFNDSLGYQWMTTEVLTKTLERYADQSTEVGKKAFAAAQDVKTATQLFDTLKEAAQSGWAMTWEYIIGDFDQAKQVWTAVSKEIGGIIDAQAAERNALFKEWSEGGGREAFLGAIQNTWNALKSIATTVKDAFRDIFPAMTSDRFIAFTKSLEEFTSKLTMGKDVAEKFGNTFRGIFAVFDILKSAISGFGRAFAPFLSFLPGIGKSFIGATSGIGDFIVKLDETIKSTDFFYNAFKKVADVLMSILAPALAFVSPKFEAIANQSKSLGDAILSLFTSAGEKAGGGSGLLGGIAKLASFLKDKLGSAVDFVKKQLDKFDLDRFKTLVSTIVSGGLGVSIIRLINQISKGIKGLLDGRKLLDKIFDRIDDVVEPFVDSLDKIKDALSAMQTAIKSKAILSIAIAVGIFTASLVALSTLDAKDLAKSLGGIGAGLAELIGTLKALDVFVKSSSNAIKSAFALTTLATAVLTMSKALKTVSDLKPDQLAQGLFAISVMLAELTAAAKLLSSGSDKMMKGSTGLIILAAAVRVLAFSVKAFGEMDPDVLSQGLFAVTVALGELAGFAYASSKISSNMMSMASGLLILSVALILFTSSIKKLGGMDYDALSQGFLAFTGILTALSLFTKSLSDTSTKMISLSAGMLILSVAVAILAKAVNTMGQMNTDELGKGLIGLGAILTALSVFTQSLSGVGTKMITMSVGMLILSAAITVLTNAVGTLGEMKYDAISQGMVGLAAILAMLAGFTVVLDGMSSKILVISAGLLILSAALTVIVGVIAGLGSLDPTQLTQGLIGIAAALTVLSVGLGAMSGTLAGSAALLIASIALMALAPALIALGSIDITTLMTSLATVAAVLIGIAAASALLTPMIGPMAAVSVAVLAFGAALAVLGLGLVAVGAGLKVLSSGITEFVNMIKTQFPSVGDAISGVIDTFTSFIGNGIAKAKELGTNLISNLTDGVKNKVGDFKSGVGSLVSNGISAIKSKVSAFKSQGATLISNFVNGVKSKISSFKQNVSTMIKNGISAITGRVSKFKSEGAKLMTNVANGVKSKANDVKEKIKSAVQKGEQAIKGLVGSFRSVGANLIQGLVNGVASKISALKNKVAEAGSLAHKAIKKATGVASPSKLFYQTAVFWMQGLINGVNKLSSRLSNVTAAAGESAFNALDEAMQKNASINIGANVTNSTFTPVLDMSKLDASTLALTPAIQGGVTGSNLDAVNRMFSSRQNGSDNSDIITALDRLGRGIKEMPRNNYNIAGVTYDDGSAISDAVQSLVRAAKIEGRR